MKRSALFLAAGFIAGAALAANVVGAGDSNPSFYTVTQGDSWQSIATAHGVPTVGALQRFNCPGNQTTTLPSSCTGTPRVGRGLMIPEAVTPPTSTTPATSTVAPTTTTTAPPTTTVPASTTTVAPTTTQAPTTTVAPSTTAPSPTTTSPPAGAFSEDFSTPNVFCGIRFDCGVSGEVAAGALFNDNANDWPGDHDMSCGDPNGTRRTIHVEPGRGLEPGTGDSMWAVNRDITQAFYQCAPGGDPAKAHAMVSFNTEGYATVWFSPKQIFTNVTRVCWDQNITDLKPEKWTGLLFLLPSEYSGPNSQTRGRLDLGYDTHDFPDGPTADQGPAQNGVSTHQGTMTSFSNGGNLFSLPRGTNNDKAPRYQHCVIDNGNGTLTMTFNRAASVPDGLPQPKDIVTRTGPGSIPDGTIRVVLTDEMYNPDKHQEPPVSRDSSGLYTWHYDNLVVEQNVPG